MNKVNGKASSTLAEAQEKSEAQTRKTSANAIDIVATAMAS